MDNVYSETQLSMALAQGSATLYEASGLENSALDYNIKATWQDAQLAAPAFTVHCAPRDNLAIQIALEIAPSGSVLVVKTDNVVAGYWGEVLTVAAQSRGIVGLVIDGGIRDSAAIRRMAFPVFARAISIKGTHKATAPSVGEPIQISGTPVKSGDLVVADNDGVVVIPQQLSADVLQKAAQREAKEADFMGQLKQGKSTLELMGLAQWSLRKTSVSSSR